MKFNNSLKIKNLMVLLTIIIITIVLAITIDKNSINKLIAWIRSMGLLAPIIYIIIHTLAPVFFIPALPLTISAGIIFGPVYGVIYTSIGLTLGASLSFTTARYAIKGLFPTNIDNKIINKINDNISKYGWQSVIITRVFLLMPSIVVNYTYGITKIKFWHYAISTFVSMIIISLAFVPLSSSIPDIIKGDISYRFVIGLAIFISFTFALFIRKKFLEQKNWPWFISSH